MGEEKPTKPKRLSDDPEARIERRRARTGEPGVYRADTDFIAPPKMVVQEAEPQKRKVSCDATGHAVDVRKPVDGETFEGADSRMKTGMGYKPSYRRRANENMERRRTEWNQE